MRLNATNIATGTSLLGAGVVTGVLLAPHNAESRRPVTAAAPPPVVRTVHIKRVHHRTIHERARHAVHAAAPAHAAAAVVPAAQPVRLVAAPPPAPVQHPLRTRTSGSGGGSGSGGEHESEHGDD
jgi:hypothetical protein